MNLGILENTCLTFLSVAPFSQSLLIYNLKSGIIIGNLAFSLSHSNNLYILDATAQYNNLVESIYAQVTCDLITITQSITRNGSTITSARSDDGYIISNGYEKYTIKSDILTFSAFIILCKISVLHCGIGKYKYFTDGEFDLVQGEYYFEKKVDEKTKTYKSSEISSLVQARDGILGNLKLVVELNDDMEFLDFKFNEFGCKKQYVVKVKEQASEPSIEIKSEYLHVKQEMKQGYLNYVGNTDIRLLLNDYVELLLQAKPDDVYEFTVGYFGNKIIQ